MSCQYVFPIFYLSHTQHLLHLQRVQIHPFICPPSIVAKNYSLFVTVAGINTNVIVALEGSIDGTNWAKVIANTTLTANGTTHSNVANHPLRYIRPVFVSESGGTAATVLFSIAAAN